MKKQINDLKAKNYDLLMEIDRLKELLNQDEKTNEKYNTGKKDVIRALRQLS